MHSRTALERHFAEDRPRSIVRGPMDSSERRWYLVAALIASSCGSWTDDAFCSREGCEFAPGEWDRISALSGLHPPPLDKSNRWSDSEPAAQLGQKFFFDTAFSGTSRQLDALKRPVTLARVPVGQELKISCATCHDLRRGGADTTS